MIIYRQELDGDSGSAVRGWKQDEVKEDVSRVS